MASVCSVSIQTWGTNANYGSGTLQHFDNILFGANVGHAAITLKFPANAEGERLVQQYCYSDDPDDKAEIIPVIKHSVKNSLGETEEIYEVRFSWWPAVSGPGALMPSISSDRINERSRVQFDWSEEATEVFDPEQREYKGLLGSNKKTLGPQSILHLSNLNNEAIEVIKANARLIKLNEFKKAAEILLARTDDLPAKSFPLEISDSFRLLIENILPEHLEKIGLNKDSNLIKNPKQIKILTEQKITELQDTIKKLEELVRKNSHLVPGANVYDLGNLKKQIQNLNTKRQKMYEDKSSLAISNKKHQITKKSNPRAFKEMLKNIKKYFEKWENHVANTDILTKDEIEFFATQLQDKMDALLEEIEEINIRHNKLYNLLLEQFAFYGHIEDSDVILPIRTFPNTSIGNPKGLNVETMLQQMKSLVTDDAQAFDLYSKNCSETVGRILEAGVDDPYLKRIAAKRSWGAFGNPQMVRNSATQIQNEVFSNRSAGFFKRLSSYTPLQGITGVLLKVIVNGEKNIIIRFAAGVGLAAIAVPVFVARIIRGIINPLAMYKECSGIISFTYSRPSNLLKISATIFVVPVAALFAVPAAIQAAIATGLINPIARIFKSTLDNDPGSEPGTGSTDNTLNLDKYRKQAAWVSNHTVEITSTNPEQAIYDFIDVLCKNKNLIPIFSLYSNKAIKKMASSDKLLTDNLKKYIKELPEEIYNEIFSNIDFNSIPYRVRKKSSITREEFSNLSIEERKELLLNELLTINCLLSVIGYTSLKRSNISYETSTEEESDNNQSDLLVRKENILFNDMNMKTDGVSDISPRQKPQID